MQLTTRAAWLFALGATLALGARVVTLEKTVAKLNRVNPNFEVHEPHQPLPPYTNTLLRDRDHPRR